MNPASPTRTIESPSDRCGASLNQGNRDQSDIDDSSPGRLSLYYPIGPRCYRLLHRHTLSGLHAMAGHSRYLFPLLDRQQALNVASRWTLPRHGCAWVCRLEFAAEQLHGFPRRDWSNSGREEYRIPVTALEPLSQHLLASPEIIDHLTLSDANPRLLQYWINSCSLVTEHQLHAQMGEKPLPFLPSLTS
ncbi:hypothetical protein MIB92_06335 [Aestuariirhabdus sp. Z084]|uniref:hypothetical protein n=1 Tax=Aestuariirhabdus haliotis TaxID=2918751 RepID=UPI00201B3562|nr:hypothetical protein [Aestuariirhabdus haliotis]MCL6415260.1 hypothetical protein [Aestuariirhabdus haliotis]MCL6419520.1 hypothetical protein [Aestuariirhabdus haliotis]